jgi:hypothetical protein
MIERRDRDHDISKRGGTQKLSTAYTDLSALVSTLKSEGFSGTIEIEFPA